MAFDTQRVSNTIRDCDREPFRSLKALLNGNEESVEALEPLIWDEGATEAKTDETAVRAIEELKNRRAYNTELSRHAIRACIFKNMAEIQTAMQTKWRDSKGNTIDVQIAASYEHRHLVNLMPMSDNVPLLGIEETGIHQLRQKLIIINSVAQNLDIDDLIELMMSQLQDIGASPATDSVETTNTDASEAADQAPPAKRQKTMGTFSTSKLKRALEKKLRAGEFEKLNQVWKEIRW
jgi:hypothetical protein